MKKFLIWVVALAVGVGIYTWMHEGPRTITETEYECAKVSVFEDILITSYTNSKKECGHTHGITKSGLKAKVGHVACNFLPFGTKVRIPALFGDKVFTVTDRLATRKIRQIDIFVKYPQMANSIGRTVQTIEVVD